MATDVGRVDSDCVYVNVKRNVNVKSFLVADLRFLSPQPDTSFYTARPRIRG